ncbi:MAG: pantoate--beta-alanine ligase [Gammaproteobacteria bacterium]|nr:pantoate--beta-alanine ligase [Gammaproteobacteria bacterium]
MWLRYATAASPPPNRASDPVKILQQIPPLRQQIRQWRQQNERIALVATMGNLHQGHLALIAEAQQRADRVVATIFVNPLQFAAGEDLSRYPRTPKEDYEALRSAGCDLLFAPEEAVIYPDGRSQPLTRVEVPALSDTLCGIHRPGHFNGVATVVLKLLHLTTPDLALFGEKDFQQLQIIRRLCYDLNLETEIVAVATVREADGLALSSRNGYLTTKERAVAPNLYRILGEMAQAVERESSGFRQIEVRAMGAATEAGFVPEYFALRRRGDLQPAERGEKDLIALAAVRLGTTRLIDNLQIG